MSKALVLHNTFTRTSKPVELAGRLIKATNLDSNSELPQTGSFYICGPTVYSESHVGHALTYIRADLFRRFMKSLFNVRLHTVMNITDIDDKIIDKSLEENDQKDSISSDPARHPFNNISDKYYQSFLNDMRSIRCLPADQYVRISKHVPLITSFIQRLEEKGHAYTTTEGDVRFKVSSLLNYIGRVDERVAHSSGNSTQDSRDFVLWKAAKPKEPIWFYNSPSTNRRLPGRPGWHVQCSAISSALFGNKLDFHFGGKDLIFPHHYNEEACCCAYHSLDTSTTLHVWSSNWLHSGHLVISERKMSKSIGNVVPIKKFISRSSVNALRLLCIQSHYRSDLSFNEELLDNLKALDHKINAFFSFLSEKLQYLRENQTFSYEDQQHDNDIEQALLKTHNDIIDGVCDDFHLDVGLDSILNLVKLLYSKCIDDINPRTLTNTWYLIKSWSKTCGLEYGYQDNSTLHDDSLRNILVDFRQRVREISLNELKSISDKKSNSYKVLSNLLKECDSVRSKLDEHNGIILRDKPASDING